MHRSYNKTEKNVNMLLQSHRKLLVNACNTHSFTGICLSHGRVDQTKQSLHRPFEWPAERRWCDFYTKWKNVRESLTWPDEGKRPVSLQPAFHHKCAQRTNQTMADGTFNGTDFISWSAFLINITFYVKSRKLKDGEKFGETLRALKKRGWEEERERERLQCQNQE